MATPIFQRAERRAIKLKLAVSGPSGAGKTLGALALAAGLSKKVALIDTENGSASSYADRFSFDVLNLEPPFTSARYIEAIDAAIDAGYELIVVDSLSHQWMGEGGILQRKEELDKRPGSNSYTNWATFTKEHTTFLAKILHAPVHIIATIRSKQDYVLETNERGKQQPKKVGMAPVQRDGLEYEFTTVFELQMDHRATVSKDRTGLFEGDLIDLQDKKLGARLRDWLTTAKAEPASPPPAAKAPAPAPAEPVTLQERIDTAIDAIDPAGALDIRVGKDQKTLGSMSREGVEEVRKWAYGKAEEAEAQGADNARLVGIIAACDLIVRDGLVKASERRAAKAAEKAAAQAEPEPVAVGAATAIPAKDDVLPDDLPF